MTEYQKKFAMSEILVIKHMPPVQFKTKKLKTQANNDCEQYCAHIIGYGFEFFGKTEEEVKDKAKDFLKHTKKGEFIPGVLPYDKFINIPSIGAKYTIGVKYCFISPDGEEEIKSPSQMSGQLNNVPLFNKMTDSIGNYATTMSSEDLLHSMFDTNAFLNAGIQKNIGPFNVNTNQFYNNIPTIRYAVNTEEKKPSTSTEVDSTDDSIQLPVLIEEITMTTSDNKVCIQYSGYVYGLDMCRIVEDSISEVVSKCNELVSKISINDILTPKTIDGKPSEDHIIKTLKYFSTKGRTVMLSYCTKKLI